jgi:hypothetical protein
MTMRVEYTITGTLTLPAGSVFVEGSENSIRLPDGGIISVHPILEHNEDGSGEVYHDLSFVSASALGVEIEDYDRHTNEVEA